jgi:hypothetical protein
MKGRIAALEARFGAPPPPPESQKKTDEEDFDLFGDEVMFHLLGPLSFLTSLAVGGGRGN